MPIYEYLCEPCDAATDTVCKYSEKPATLPCSQCGKPAYPCMSKPSHFKVRFDANGRVGYKVDMGDRRVLARSATREQYEHNIGNKPAKELKHLAKSSKSVYTKEYQRAVDGQKKQKFEKYVHDFKKRTEK